MIRPRASQANTSKAGLSEDCLKRWKQLGKVRGPVMHRIVTGMHRVNSPNTMHACTRTVHRFRAGKQGILPIHLIIGVPFYKPYLKLEHTIYPTFR